MSRGEPDPVHWLKQIAGEMSGTMLFGIFSTELRNSGLNFDSGQPILTEQQLGCMYFNLCLLVVKDGRVNAKTDFEDSET